MVEFTFTAVEIDLDYEFEAARYFDFSREESTAEAREAELWFESAASYPPSPFVLKLVSREELLLGNVNVSPKSKGLENMSLLESGPNIGLGLDACAMHMRNRDCDGMNAGFSMGPKSNVQKFQNHPHNLRTGFTFCDHTGNANFKSKTKSSLKPSFPRTSTLMKPTASQLAKQNRQPQMENSRFQKFENKEKSSNNSSTNEIQAAKRQKLEGGHLHKIPETKQQTNLVHKTPKREGITEGNLAHGRLRITIPREPPLETAHRARRMRPKTNKEHEHVPSAAPAFKALPLNRKILEAPSLSLPKRSTPHLPEFQEFHLKTSERAMQHTSAVSSSLVYCNNPKMMRKPSVASVTEGSNGVYRRPHLLDAPKQEGSESTHKFKALPLNRKIFSSKGDLGVSRNSKRETTVPMEFNFHTGKRFQHDPPVDLFNKLSLTSELQQSTTSQLKLPRSTSIFEKRIEWSPSNKKVR